MGYSTKFSGAFTVTPPLSYEDRAELRARIEDEEWLGVDGFDGPPDAYCQWRPTKDGAGLEWDQGEKFYDYDEWIAFLAAYLKPKGYTVSGSVRFRGESFEDAGVLSITDGVPSKSPLAAGAWADVADPQRTPVLKALAEAARDASDDAGRDGFAAALAALGAPARKGRR